MHIKPHAPTVLVAENNDDLSASLAQFVATISANAVRRHGKFTVAVSGGSLPKLLAADFRSGTVGQSVDWDKWHVFFADERCVPLNDPESNYRLLKEELLNHVPIPAEQVYTLNEDLLLGKVELTDSFGDEDEENPEERGDSARHPTVAASSAAQPVPADPDTLAEEYMDQLLQVFASRDSVKFPVFDLILLGIGPDGHTCSLFPGHTETLEEQYSWVVSVSNSPKPPPQRITLTLPVLNHAHYVAFVATGAGKQETLRTIFTEPDSGLPAQMVVPQTGELFWFVDRPAAFLLPESTLQLPAAKVHDVLVLQSPPHTTLVPAEP